jgi:hypothetical protein
MPLPWLLGGGGKDGGKQNTLAPFILGIGVRTLQEPILHGRHCFNLSTPPHSNHMNRQALTGDAVLIKSIEMPGRSQTMAWWLGGRVKTTENKILARLC